MYGMYCMYGMYGMVWYVLYIWYGMVWYVLYGMYVCMVCMVFIRDATIQFFQIRSDPENSAYRPIPIQSDTSAGFFFINVEFLYFCVTLLCVKHNLLDNWKKYIGTVYTWSLHAFCNINPIAQTTSGGVNASGCWNHICKFYSSQNVKNNKRVRPCYRLYDIIVRYDCANATRIALILKMSW